jgi:hypothetical protein
VTVYRDNPRGLSLFFSVIAVRPAEDGGMVSLLCNSIDAIITLTSGGGGIRKKRFT